MAGNCAFTNPAFASSTTDRLHLPRCRAAQPRGTTMKRTIALKYAGRCACCGAPMAKGSIADYYPRTRQVAHVGGLDGNSGTCTANIREKRFPEYAAELRRREQDPGFVDLDRMYEDQCA